MVNHQQIGLTKFQSLSTALATNDGQTIGLTQDAPLVGHWAALRWGLLGLAIKGGIWIGFAGVFLGMGLSGILYRARWLAFSWLGLLAVCALGIWIFNEPFVLIRESA